MFQDIAGTTLGIALPLDRASETAELLEASILETLRPKIQAQALGPRRHWVKSLVPRARGSHHETVYSVELQHDPDTPPGLYDIPVGLNILTPDQATAAGGQVRIRVVVGWYNHPLVPF